MSRYSRGFKGPVEAFYDARHPDDKDKDKNEKLDELVEQALEYNDELLQPAKDLLDGLWDKLMALVDDLLKKFALPLTEAAVLFVLGIIVLEKLL